jgi:mannose-1-phosphate guanylyltransferase/mannose-6-phosphate isomerase
MCGGSGTRVWPESRESLPKQFIPLIGDRSTFQSIVGAVGDRAIFEPPVVITNFDYRFRVAEQLIEVQTGSYLGEDDIIRIDDIYNRHL